MRYPKTVLAVNSASLALAAFLVHANINTAEAGPAHAPTSATEPKGVFCVSDGFKEACASNDRAAFIEFALNPRKLTAQERQARQALDDEDYGRGKTAEEYAEHEKGYGSTRKTTHAPKVSVAKANNIYIQQQFEDSTGVHRGKKYPVPTEYASVLRDATKGSRITYDIMVQLMGSESGFKNVTSHTNAIGAAQMTSDALKQGLYDNKEKLPQWARNVVETNLKRVNVAAEGEPAVIRYRYKKGADVNAVRALATNPAIATILACEHAEFAATDGETRFKKAVAGRIKFLQEHPERNTDPQRMARLKQHLNRDWTSADIKIVYLMGASGGSEFLAAYADTKNLGQRASDYTADIVSRGNPDVFYKKDSEGNRHNKSVSEVYGYIVSRVGAIPVADNANPRPTPPVAKPWYKFG